MSTIASTLSLSDLSLAWLSPLALSLVQSPSSSGGCLVCSSLSSPWTSMAQLMMYSYGSLPRPGSISFDNCIAVWFASLPLTPKLEKGWEAEKACYLSFASGSKTRKSWDTFMSQRTATWSQLLTCSSLVELNRGSVIGTSHLFRYVMVSFVCCWCHRRRHWVTDFAMT